MNYVKQAESLAGSGDVEGLEALGTQLQSKSSPEARLGLQAVEALFEVALRNAMANVQPD
jgi:hypothetical protein